MPTLPANSQSCSLVGWARPTFQTRVRKKVGHAHPTRLGAFRRQVEVYHLHHPQVVERADHQEHHAVDGQPYHALADDRL